MPRFPLVGLTDMCDVLSGGTPSTKRAEYWNGGIPWASVKDFNTAFRWFMTTEKNISQEGLENCSSVLLEPGELILSARGTVGVVAQAGIRTAFNQSNYGLRAKAQVGENDFLYYALLNSKRTLLGEAHGGMFDTITRATLERLSVPCPPLTEQKRIAQILGLFDKKIAVNLELSETLQALAESIFRSWFIDFDPVKAKMAGDTPVGMDAETAALFPDSMEDSGLGEIPSGWGVVEAGEIAFTTIGGLWGADDSEEGRSSSYYCLRGTDLDDLTSTGLAERTPVRWDKAESIGKRQSSNNHVLIGGSGAGPVGKSLLWDSSIDALFDSPVIYSNFVKRFETSTQAEATFLYFLLQEMLSSGEIFEHVGGTSVPNLLDKTLLESKRFAMPPEPLLKVFDALYRAALQIRYSGQSKYLAQLRDALLPRLISGELEIPDEMVAA